MALTAPPRLEPFTLEHFVAYGRRLVLDTGENWEPEDFQLEIVKPILQGVRETWVLLPQGNAKELAVDTRIPTPDGWTTMLALQRGDEVLGSNGLPTRVTYTSEVKFDKDCYRITFSDGAAVICSGDHPWPVEDARDHYASQVQTTRYLYNRPLRLPRKGKDGISTVARWRVPTVARIASPEVELAIEPYVLGVWLGDGASDCGRITNVDQEVWDRLQEGHEISPVASLTRARTHTVYGLKKSLRRAGLLGNKHIPEAYLVADEQQRWSLLQGLMDTDGTISKAGQATYCTTSERLARDVCRLVWSLGLPCHTNKSRSVLAGVDYGISYKLTIACDQRHPVVSLTRKAERLKARGLTCEHRRITKVERVRTVPTKCIQVDAPDRLYLCTDAYIPTHNTTLMAIVSLYHADYTPSPWVPIGASSRDQAEIMFMQAAEIVRASPGMIKRFRVYEGYRKIVSLRNGGRGIRVYAADASTGDGVIPTLALLDEGHRHPDLSLYRLWKGKLNKRRGQIVMISTAGEPGSEFEETRDLIRSKVERKHTEGAHIISQGRNITMHEWQVRDPRFIDRMDEVKEANPLSIITEDTLRDEFESPTTDLGDWKRLVCNIPSRTNRAAITDAEWEEAKEPRQLPGGEHIDVGVDVAWKHDTFAIAPLWRGPEYRLLGAPQILVPPRDGSTMHPDEVKQAFYEVHESNPIDAAVMDMERAEDIAAWLEDELDIMVIDRPQGNANAIEDYDAFMQALRNGTLKHTGDRGLRNHVMNAIVRAMPADKKRFDRPSQSRAKKRQNVRVIDALTAAAMVNHYAASSAGMGEPLVAWRHHDPFFIEPEFADRRIIERWNGLIT